MTETSPVCAMAVPAEGRAADRGDGLAGQDGPGHRRRRAAGGRRGRDRRCPPTGSRWASSRCADRGSPAPTTATPRPSGSTTAGCGPGTSAVARRPGVHADLGPDQGRHQVRRGVDLVGRARERGDGPSRRVRGGRHRRARRHAGTNGRSWWWWPSEGARPRPRTCSSSSPGGWPGGGCPSAGPSSTELPKTSVGKFDKKVLRTQVADGTIEIHEVEHAAARRLSGGGRRGAGRAPGGQLSEELGDLAFDRVREASRLGRSGSGPRSRAGARRSVGSRGPAGRSRRPPRCCGWWRPTTGI